MPALDPGTYARVSAERGAGVRVGNDEGMVPGNPARGDGRVTSQQLAEGGPLAGPGDEPQDAPGTAQDGVGECHAAKAVVGERDSHVTVVHLEDRVAGHQRGRVPVFSEAEMDDVEDARLAAHATKCLLVADCCQVGVGERHRHGVHVGLGNGHPIQQLAAQAREVSVRVILGTDALIALKDVDLAPGQVAGAQSGEHVLRRATATDGDRAGTLIEYGLVHHPCEMLGRDPAELGGLDNIDSHRPGRAGRLGVCVPWWCHRARIFLRTRESVLPTLDQGRARSREHAGGGGSGSGRSDGQLPAWALLMAVAARTVRSRLVVEAGKPAAGRRGGPARFAMAVLLLALAACGGRITSPPVDDARQAHAEVTGPASPEPPPPAPDRTGLQDALDAVAAAFLARDPVALRPWLSDPDSLFGRRWLARAENLRDVPLEMYGLELDPSLPDLTTAEVRARHGPTAQVVYVVEKHALEGFDDDGPAAEDLFLTVVRVPADDAASSWRVVGDADAEPLGLVSVDHLWDHGPVVAQRAGGFLALSHPGGEAVARLVLDETAAARVAMGAHWTLPWSGKVPLIIPRDERELRELLHVTFDLSTFVAFATATPWEELGEFRLTGARVVLNTERFLTRPSETRRRILAHELLHVATRPHAGPAMPAWVEEGLAQRLGEQDSTTGTDLLTAVTAQGFAGVPPEDAAFTRGPPDRIFLSYQLAWSFADFLADSYGETALARFYAALGRGSVGKPGRVHYHVDRSARLVFGAPLRELEAAWARRLRGS